MTEAEQLEEARRWLRFATEDLEVAEAVAKDPELTPRAACLHAQQAGEKAIKAALVASGVNFPRIHNLNALRNLLPAGWSVKGEQPDLAELSEWAVEARYPADLPAATREDAQRAVRQAREIHESVVADLEKRSRTQAQHQDTASRTGDTATKKESE